MVNGATACDAIECGVNERVVSHACAPCPPGTVNAAGGDDASANEDTDCDPVVCGVDERVRAHACVACADGTTNRGGGRRVRERQPRATSRRRSGDDAHGRGDAVRVVRRRVLYTGSHTTASAW